LSGQDSSDRPKLDPSSSSEASTSPGSSKRLERLVVLAWAALAFECIWRRLVFPLCVIGIFLCLSWAGLWLEVPHEARIILVLGLAALFGFSLLRLVRITLPSRKDALDRIDQASGFAHRPASVLDDRLANADADPVTKALWDLHKRRAAQFIGRLRSGGPSPRVVEIDRYGLRAAVLVALIACAFLAGPEKYARVAAAFDWRGAGTAGSSYRLDAWIDPPPYTGKAPVLLNLGAPETKSTDHPEVIEAPAGSTIIVRSSGGETGIETHGALKEAAIADGDGSKPSAAKASPGKPANSARLNQTQGEDEHRFLLSGDAGLTLHHAGALVGTFEIHAIADQPPIIALTEVPKANARGTLTLAYRLADDYGVTSASAAFSNPKAPDGTAIAGRSLVDPPHADLTLAPGAGGLGDAETTADLSDHPWAGLRVTMTLSAKDEGGNEGKSEPAEITLPRKPLSNPLARALAEQRRNLLLQPDDKTQVETALSALMIAPEAYGTKASVYLGLRIASDQLAAAKTDADLIALADYLWDMALRIENGDLSDAEREMRDAEQKLRDALQRNASPEEIRKLTENLRAAMDKFVNQLAQRDPSERGNPERGQSQNKSVTPKELQSMLDRMQDLAKSGNMADAQKALDQLQNILENLKSANKRNTDQRSRETSRALNDLDRMSKDQQDLRDETYKQSQGNDRDQDEPRSSPRGQRQQQGQQNSRNRQPNPGAAQDSDEDDEDAQMNPGQGKNKQGNSGGQQTQESMEQLKQRQQALRQSLDQLQKRLKQMGQDGQGLDEAQSAMQDAEKALSEGQEGENDAVDAQGRALDSLRKGAQKLAQQLKQQQQGQGEAEGGEEGGEGSSQQSEDSGDADPAGRPRANSTHNPGANSPFDPMGTPAVQRAQRVLDELRRRLSDPNRTREETDYLERLLRRY